MTPESIPTNDLIAQARDRATTGPGEVAWRLSTPDFLTALAAALEATAAERDRAHATLREIRALCESERDPIVAVRAKIHHLARERLENP